MKKIIYRVAILMSVMPYLYGMQKELRSLINPQDELIVSAYFLKSCDEKKDPLIAMLSSKGTLYAGSFNASMLQAFQTVSLLKDKAIAMKRVKGDMFALVADNTEQEPIGKKSLFLVDIKKLLAKNTAAVSKLASDVLYTDIGSIKYKNGFLIAGFTRQDNKFCNYYWDFKNLNTDGVPLKHAVDTIIPLPVTSEVASIVTKKRKFVHAFVSKQGDSTSIGIVEDRTFRTAKCPSGVDVERIKQLALWEQSDGRVSVYDDANSVLLKVLDNDKAACYQFPESTRIVGNYITLPLKKKKHLEIADKESKDIIEIIEFDSKVRDIKDIAKTGHFLLAISMRGSLYVDLEIGKSSKIAEHEAHRRTMKRTEAK